VTEAAGKCYGHKNQDGFIRSTFKSRTDMTYFETKADFAKTLQTDKLAKKFSALVHLASRPMVGWDG